MPQREFCKTRIDNGVTVVTERWGQIRSVSLGAWVRAGARDETPTQQGISHFIEHTAFKGTAHRSAFEIANSLESLGGSLDAFTGRDVTCYFARCLGEHWEAALSVLADLLQHPTFDAAEIEKERRVVLEEIQSVEDAPEDLIHDLVARAVWGEHPVGAPILGVPETVCGLSAEDLRTYHDRHYVPEGIVISAAGQVDHDALVSRARRLFGRTAPSRPMNGGPPPEGAAPSHRHYPRDIGQTHFCLGATAFPYNHPRQYDMLVAEDVLGGGMTSRLFQEVREARGLAYNVYSYLEMLEDTGLFGMYMACDRSRLDEASSVVREQIGSLGEEGVTPEELDGAKARLRAELILGSESMSRRMSSIAHDEIYLSRYCPPEEALDRIERVTREGVVEACREVMDGHRMHEVTLGP